MAACSSPKNANPHILIKTKLDDIEVELYAQQAPKTVSAFLSYIDSGYFKHAAFYRVLRADEQPSDAPKSELIQGGIWQTDYKLARTIPGIIHKSTQQTKILHKGGTKFCLPCNCIMDRVCTGSFIIYYNCINYNQLSIYQSSDRHSCKEFENGIITIVYSITSAKSIMKFYANTNDYFTCHHFNFFFI